MADLEPAVQVASIDEARALRIAVSHALADGLATDDFDGTPCNRSLVSLARKIGCEIPEWCADA